MSQNPAKKVQERAARYVATLPPAISGTRGHDALFRVACVLANGFDLSDSETWPILLEYNARCLPPWSERELRHKLSQARKVAHQKPVGYLLGAETQSSPPPRVLGRIALRTPPPAQDEPPSVDMSEALRMANELDKLNRAGALAGPQDHVFYLQLIHLFGGTYVEH